MCYFRNTSQAFIFLVLLLASIVDNYKVEESTNHESTNYESTTESLDYDNENAALAFVLVVIIYLLIVAGFIYLVAFSIMFIVAGCVVAAQWPQPNFCCWTLPMNDRSPGACCCCCSLYWTNVSFAVVWLVPVILSFTLLPLEPSLFCCVLCILHIITSIVLFRKFRKFGWPAPNDPANYIAPVIEMNETAVVKSDEDSVTSFQQIAPLLDNSADRQQ